MINTPVNDTDDTPPQADRTETVYTLRQKGRCHSEAIPDRRQSDGTMRVSRWESSLRCARLSTCLGSLCTSSPSPFTTRLTVSYRHSSTYLVVNNLDWIQCRVLIVEGTETSNVAIPTQLSTTQSTVPATLPVDDFNILPLDQQRTKPTPLDPAHPLVLDGRRLNIPNLLPKLEAIKQKVDLAEEELNDSDEEILAGLPLGSQSRAQVKDAFIPAGPEIISLIRLLPPPSNPNVGASLAVQREMRAMLATQKADGPSVCGYYFDPVSPSPSLF